MPGEEIKIGPFVGGLNTFSDPTSIEDTELTELVNFELDLDGSLVSRPPIVDTGVNMTLDTTGNMKLLGWYVTSGGAPYLIGSDGLTKTYYFDGTSWTLITDTFAASAMTQFRDKAWLVAPIGESDPGGTWDPSSGFSAEANMPRGSVIISNKERLWLGLGADTTANGTRLYLTDLVSGVPTWSSPASYVDIGPGDGQKIVDLAVYYSDLIVFKQGSTYRFAFDTDPSVGTISRVSANIGATDARCNASYENRLYVLFDNKVYEFTNYTFDRLNDKVPLEASNPSVTLAEYNNISIWADRLFVTFYDTTFVYSLKTRTWTTWQSDVLSNIGRVLPIPGQQGVQPVAYTYSTVPRTSDLYKISDFITADSEEMTCILKTKNYDYLTPNKFKRLFWWGVDVLCKTAINAEVTPITYVTSVTWNDVKNSGLTIDQLAATGTWDRPLDVTYAVSELVSTSSVIGDRKYVKFMKSLRFRLVNFKLSISTDGSSAEAPVRVFRLLTGVRDKQLVSDRIS